MLYGCQSAAGNVGEEFITKLHIITGANMAASNSLTGNSLKGGSWALEVSRAEVNQSVAFTEEVKQAYTGVLKMDPNIRLSQVRSQIELQQQAITYLIQLWIENVYPKSLLETIFVNTLTDEKDGIDDGEISLRDAIEYTNNLPGENTMDTADDYKHGKNSLVFSSELTTIFDIHSNSYIIRGNEEKNKINGTKDSEILEGLEGKDQLKGKKGDDTLIGGQGKDVLIGGKGKDEFTFNFSDKGVDKIQDFEEGKDIIVIKANGFSDDLEPGTLDNNQFTFGKYATHKQNYFIYDGKKLYFDADGVGGEDQVQIATFNGFPDLSNEDILVI